MLRCLFYPAFVVRVFVQRQHYVVNQHNAVSGYSEVTRATPVARSLNMYIFIVSCQSLAVRQSSECVVARRSLSGYANSQGSGFQHFHIHRHVHWHGLLFAVHRLYFGCLRVVSGQLHQLAVSDTCHAQPVVCSPACAVSQLVSQWRLISPYILSTHFEVARAGVTLPAVQVSGKATICQIVVFVGSCAHRLAYDTGNFAVYHLQQTTPVIQIEVASKYVSVWAYARLLSASQSIAVNALILRNGWRVCAYG